MRVVKKTVCYCDFCKKHSLNSLVEHEKHCTLNPNRHCRLCKTERNYSALVETIKPLKDEIETFWSIKGEDLMDLADGCPICALTILRLFKKKHKGEYENINVIGFNYKEEVQKWWDAENEEAERQELYRD